MAAQPPRPRIIRIIPDPGWGRLLIGATPDQRRRFDAWRAKDRATARKARNVGVAVMVLGSGLLIALWGDTRADVVGALLLLFGGMFTAAGVAAQRSPTLRLRNWGVYEEGILCTREPFRTQPGLMRWEEIAQVELLYEWAYRRGGPQYPTWTIWVKGPRRRLGVVRPEHLEWFFGMDEGERTRARDAIIREARRHLGDGKVVTVATRGARAQLMRRAAVDGYAARGAGQLPPR